MPTATDTYVPVVDISQHQGVCDLAVMREQGVEGLIIRSNHAQVVDKRCARYVMDARAAGWGDDQLGAYTFANPKRATGAASGKAFVDTVQAVFGRTDLLLMLDIESYASESGAGPVLQGDAYAAWIRDHIATVHTLAPDCRLIAYSNAAFWDGDAYPVTGVHGPWVGDGPLARSLEWIVPRYPVYTPAGYVAHPVPSPTGWDEWAWTRGPTGPRSPSGAPWQGWQFSAGFNGQGARYGCSSSDLDLNIVELSAWQRWTRTPPTTPPPPPVDEEEYSMKIKTPGQWFEKCGVDLRAIANGAEYAGLGGNEVVLTNAEMEQLLATCRYTYGAAKSEMGASFVAAWNAKKQPAPSSGGGGTPTDYVGTIQLTHTVP